MIADGKVVTLHYTLKDEGGEVIDQSSKEHPFAYIHGAGQIVPGLEKELVGAGTGDKKEVKVTPDEGYGEVNPELEFKVERSNFPADKELEEGMQFSAEMKDGRQVPFIITKLDGDDVHINGNHPLAGKTLHFSVEVGNIRDATDEEKSHGHVHGEGGVQH
ncbi:MAG: peptidylprolyl isomerase [Candidatus Nitronauta litoralis]|uniref:Peptidyl-prolyl cis-trans isomerase n=1 Tax=Candidatus Nitronauta litoralis TaxID=2705533 RepID=A0A7T0G0W1_9BACT|nr:MAG: peptidylprolyl isomerase [Candidatus Nitronauta litoralis]